MASPSRKWFGSDDYEDQDDPRDVRSAPSVRRPLQERAEPRGGRVVGAHPHFLARRDFALPSARTKMMVTSFIDEPES